MDKTVRTLTSNETALSLKDASLLQAVLAVREKLTTCGEADELEAVADTLHLLSHWANIEAELVRRQIGFLALPQSKAVQ